MTPRETANIASEALPARLKAIRKNAGLTQEELAELAECSTVALSKFEAGVNRPSFENLVAISAALKISIDDLVGQPANNKPTSTRKTAALFRLDRAARKLSPEWIESIAEIAEKAK